MLEPDHLYIKKAKVIQALLEHAMRLLNEQPKKPLPKINYNDPLDFVPYSDLQNYLKYLEEHALKTGCKSGFWKKMKEISVYFNDKESENRYHNFFQNAL